MYVCLLSFTGYATARQDGHNRSLDNKQTEHIVKKIMQLKWWRNQKTKLPKMEWKRHNGAWRMAKNIFGREPLNKRTVKIFWSKSSPFLCLKHYTGNENQ